MVVGTLFISILIWLFAPSICILDEASVAAVSGSQKSSTEDPYRYPKSIASPHIFLAHIFLARIFLVDNLDRAAASGGPGLG